MAEKHIPRREFMQQVGLAGAASLLLTRDQDVSPSQWPFADMLPKKLPEAVKLMQYGVVYVTHDNISLTGFKVGPDLVLTAGHGVSGKNRPSKISDIQIEGLTPTGKIVNTGVGRVVYSYNNDRNVPDIALMQTDAPLRGLPRFSIARTPIATADEVFFLNYEPPPPTTIEISREPDAAEQRYSTPAIYGGVVLNTAPGAEPREVVQIGIRSFGTIFDDKGRPGSSGGAVVNRSSLLVGSSVRDSKDGKTAYIQPIVPSLFLGLLSGLDLSYINDATYL